MLNVERLAFMQGECETFDLDFCDIFFQSILSAVDETRDCEANTRGGGSNGRRGICVV